MLSIEKVVRNVNGEEKVVKMAFGTGRLTADPVQPKELSTGTKVLEDSYENKLSLAFNVYDSEKKERVPVFYPIQLWGFNAERLANYGYKGREVEIRGQFKDASFTKKNGERVEREILVIESFEFRGPNKEKTGVSAGADYGTESYPTDSGDDLPF